MLLASAGLANAPVFSDQLIWLTKMRPHNHLDQPMKVLNIWEMDRPKMGPVDGGVTAKICPSSDPPVTLQ